MVIAHGSGPQNRFTIKSASGAELAGLKVGAYFPTNDARGLPRHASTILLINQTTGRIGAVVEGSAVNSYRTAAADAVATDALARPNAEVLALFGTGHQAAYEARAVPGIRKLSRLLVVDRDPVRTEAFVETLRSAGLPAEAAAAETAVRAADIIVTATTATAPLFEAVWVQPGTHISSMGSDSQGKQELPTEVFRDASLFCDLPEQSAHWGSSSTRVLRQPQLPSELSCSARRRGRQHEGEITIFDSSGILLQNLHMAKAFLDRHAGSGAADS